MDMIEKIDKSVLNPAALDGIFSEICQSSKTGNGTTSMFLEEDTVKKILSKNGISEIDLSQLRLEKEIFTPSLVSLLHVGGLPEERRFALIIVDVQNDFITGSLAVKDAAEVVPVINKMRNNFHTIYKTADWHPVDHISFHSNVKSGKHLCKDRDHRLINMFETVVVRGPPELQQTLWPDHCIQGSIGAEFHPDLNTSDEDINIRKGMNSCVDSYSAFWDNGDTSHTPLYRSLLEKGITDVVVCGIATDYCVGFTALDSSRHGFKTYVVDDAVKGVAPDTIAAMVNRCQDAGVFFIQSESIEDVMSQAFCRSELIDTILTSHSHFSKLLCK